VTVHAKPPQVKGDQVVDLPLELPRVPICSRRARWRERRPYADAEKLAHFTVITRARARGRDEKLSEP